MDATVLLKFLLRTQDVNLHIVTYWIVKIYVCVLRLFSLFRNNESRLMRSPFCLCILRRPLNGWTNQVKIKVQVILTTDSQSTSPSWCQAPIWDPRPIFPILSLIIFRQFQVCWFRASSLTRSRVCIFQILLGIASSAFLRESHWTQIIFYCLYFWDSPNL
jgi:hypothetical protein